MKSKFLKALIVIAFLLLLVSLPLVSAFHAAKNAWPHFDFLFRLKSGFEFLLSSAKRHWRDVK